MKKIFYLLFILSISLKCTAQSSVVNLTDRNGTRLTGVYYKDIDNTLENFIGTWKYTKGNKSLIIIIKKVTKDYNSHYYEDYLVGEYKYVENGVEIINTIPQFDSIYENQRNHNIWGNRILENTYKPKCSDCLPNEKRVELGFNDPIRQLGGELILRRVTLNGQPALKAFKRTTNYYISMDEQSPYTEMLVPSGEYMLIKQE